MLQTIHLVIGHDKTEVVFSVLIPKYLFANALLFSNQNKALAYSLHLKYCGGIHCYLYHLDFLLK